MSLANYSYCRLCAVLTSNEDVIHLQSTHPQYSEINEKLERINAFTDFSDDLLPKTVCLTCSYSLDTAYEFVLKTEQAQHKLRSILLFQSFKSEIDEGQLNLERHDSVEDYEPIESGPDVLKTEDESKKSCNIKEEFNINTENNGTLKLANESAKGSDTLKNDGKKKILSKSKKKTKSKRVKKESSSQSPTEQSWNDYIWKCAICDTQFSSFGELKIHSIQYHNICNAFRCVDCNIRKLRLDRFLIHVRRHRSYLKVMCFKCGARFPTAYKANVHKSEHNTSDHICFGCHTEFQSMEEFNKHTLEYYQEAIRKPVTPLEQEITDKLTCLLCKKTFKQRGHLNKHLLLHSKEERKKDHACDRCGKCFTTKVELTEHLMKHDNIRPFPCKICNKAFITQRQLRIHVGGHENKKPFACEQCGRCFRLRGQLWTHKKVHMDFLPYVCTVCDKRFRYKACLTQHNRLHTGVKPYSCEICPRDFTNWPNYNKHMKRRHNMDMSKKKRNPDVICPINPDAGEEVYMQTKEVLEWKNELMKTRGSSKSESHTDATDTGNLRPIA